MVDLAHHLATRRSLPASDLVPPAPSGEELTKLLTLASRVPDHAKLVPFRYIIVSGDAGVRLGEIALARARQLNGELSTKQEEAERTQFTQAPLVITVVYSPVESKKVDPWEQKLCCGGVCLNVIHGAAALGYRAQWLTKWMAYDDYMRKQIGLKDHERIAGFMHVGTAVKTPVERERPDIAAITQNWSELD